MIEIKKFWLGLKDWRDRDPLAFEFEPRRDWRIMMFGFGLILIILIITHVGLYFLWQSVDDLKGETRGTEDLLSDFSVEELELVIEELGLREVEAEEEIIDEEVIEAELID